MHRRLLDFYKYCKFLFNKKIPNNCVNLLEQTMFTIVNLFYKKKTKAFIPYIFYILVFALLLLFSLDHFLKIQCALSL
ncbi:hypothetical protein NUSPORA_00561 [Nucleospora cyclopteri]